MKHMLNGVPGMIDYPAYRTYLESIRNRLPPHVYSFAADSRHFDLTSHSSLHDAWLECVTIREPASGERQEIRRMEVELVLLGPFHDLRIRLLYQGVKRYSFSTPHQQSHGDLITHEVRLADGGHLEHELLFEHGATFLIECEDFRHSEEVIGG